MIATHSAPEIALAILSRRHARLKASLNLRPMPKCEIYWGRAIQVWEALYPGAREQGTTETPRNTK